VTPIRVLLADDHKLFRIGLKQILDREPGIVVAGEAQDGFAVVEMTKTLKPDVVLMDISMPERNGLEATRQILADCPECRVIILSMHSDRRYIVEALRAGAKGYLLKDSAPEELISVLHKVMRGQFCLSAKINEQVITDYIRMSETQAGSPFEALSTREREVLQLLSEGKSTKQIAEKLFVSAKTVETHRMHIMEKLNMHTIAELTRYAIREGLSPLE